MPTMGSQWARIYQGCHKVCAHGAELAEFAGKLAGLVDFAHELGDLDEACHGALGLLLQPLVVLPETLNLSLQHRFVLLLLVPPGRGGNGVG